MLLCLLRYDSISQRGFVMNKHQPIRLRIIVLVSFKDFVVSEAMNRECGRVVQRGYKYIYDRISLFQGSQNLHTHTHTTVPNALTTLHSHVSPPGYSTHHVQHDTNTNISTHHGPGCTHIWTYNGHPWNQCTHAHFSLARRGGEEASQQDQ